MNNPLPIKPVRLWHGGDCNPFDQIPVPITQTGRTWQGLLLV